MSESFVLGIDLFPEDVPVDSAHQGNAGKLSELDEIPRDREEPGPGRSLHVNIREDNTDHGPAHQH